MSQVSYSFFENILPEIVKVKGLKICIDKYLAHTPSKNSPPIVKKEKLTEHINKVNETALLLIKEHQLEYLIDELIRSFLTTVNVRLDLGEFVKELFLGVFVFHDYGKVNENFQRERMENRSCFTSQINNGIKHHHSELSAYLYINYYLGKLDQLELSEKEDDLLTNTILFFSDPIYKHHSKFLNKKEFFLKSKQSLERYLACINLAKENDSFCECILEKIEWQKETYTNISEPNFFPLFALVKLSFSILTSADYLATLFYSTGQCFPEKNLTKWMGLLNEFDKNDLYKRFKNTHIYNRDILENIEEKANIPWDTFNKRNPANLNKLRSKILATSIKNLRVNSSKNTFLLEAPTGAGKTNMSIACALELLQSDEKLNKIFYVFPFTTLATQTHKSIANSLGFNDDEARKWIVELHSRAERKSKNDNSEDDANYGNDWQNHIDYLFVQFPIVLMTHIRFFEILKGNQKKANYLLHQFANSVVIIDELQAYGPEWWGHVMYYIDQYGKYFNIKFILMSATLPKLPELLNKVNGKDYIELVNEKDKFFGNPNFKDRVEFDFTLLDQFKDIGNSKNFVTLLTKSVLDILEKFADNNEGKVCAIIEFITKKSALEFKKECERKAEIEDYMGNLEPDPNFDERWSEYCCPLLSGSILEPRRKEIIDWLKIGKSNDVDLPKNCNKIC